MRIGIACALMIGCGAASAGFAQTKPPTAPAGESGAAADPVGSNAPAPEAPLNAPSTYALAEQYTPGVAWFNAEYLLWFMRGEHAPPLIQSFPSNVTSATPSTAFAPTTLYPSTNNRIDYHAFNGLRLSGGFWFDTEPHIGIDGSVFMLDQNTNGATFSSPGLGAPGLARYYSGANNGQQTSLIFANPDPANHYGGSISAATTVSSIYGADLNVRWGGYAILADQTDYLSGFRYFDFRERLDVVGQANLANGTKLAVADHFATTNQFYGKQLGVNSHLYGYRSFSLDGTFKLALGGIEQHAEVSGSNTLTNAAGAANTQAQGLYAQPSNIGSYSRTRFAVLPEINLNMSYHFTPNSSMFFGYNILWLNNVARPGSQIDPVVNDSNIRYVANPTAGNVNRPQFTFHDQSFWMQGFNVGLRVQY